MLQGNAQKNVFEKTTFRWTRTKYLKECKLYRRSKKTATEKDIKKVIISLILLGYSPATGVGQIVPADQRWFVYFIHSGGKTSLGTPRQESSPH